MSTQTDSFKNTIERLPNTGIDTDYIIEACNLVSKHYEKVMGTKPQHYLELERIAIAGYAAAIMLVFIQRNSYPDHSDNEILNLAMELSKEHELKLTPKMVLSRLTGREA